MVVAGCLYFAHREADLIQDGYNQIQRGMDQADVTALMGGRGVVVAGPYTAWWNDDPLTDADSARITSAMLYCIKSKLFPISFEITFDFDNMVVGKHRFD